MTRRAFERKRIGGSGSGCNRGLSDREDVVASFAQSTRSLERLPVDQYVLAIGTMRLVEDFQLGLCDRHWNGETLGTSRTDTRFAMRTIGNA